MRKESDKTKEVGVLDAPQNLIRCFSSNSSEFFAKTQPILLYDKLESQVVAFTGFLTADECVKVRQWIESTVMERVHHDEGKGYTFRDVDRLQIADDGVASLIYERLRALLPDELKLEQGKGAHRVATGCNETIRLYRYGPGQRCVPFRAPRFERLL